MTCSKVGTYKNVDLIAAGEYLSTRGLAPVCGREIHILRRRQTAGTSSPMADSPFGKEPMDQYIYALNFLIDYIVDCRPSIRPAETVAFHSWLLKFIDLGQTGYTLWEAKADGSGFQEGVEQALAAVVSQWEKCTAYGVVPHYPNFSSYVALSDGVYDGLDTEGSRYPAPDHMTGWYMTTIRYDGDMASMRIEHYYHLAFARPDLVPYLALPPGFYFEQNSGQVRVGFDKQLLKEREEDGLG